MRPWLESALRAAPQGWPQYEVERRCGGRGCLGLGGGLRQDGLFFAVMIGVLAGLIAQSYWPRIQLFLHGGDFGITDPQFGKDLGFYAFDHQQWKPQGGD